MLLGGVDVKVILTSDVERLGKAGQVVEASDGYARNYLFPRHLAEEATPGAERRWAERQREQARHAAHEELDAQAAAAKMTERPLRLTIKVGQGGRVFGSLTTTDLAKEAKRQFGVEVERRRFDLPHPIKAPGLYEVPVHLHAHHRPVVQVLVEEEHA